MDFTIGKSNEGKGKFSGFGRDYQRANSQHCCYLLPLVVQLDSFLLQIRTNVDQSAIWYIVHQRLQGNNYPDQLS
jgi:hypothetical protein